MADNKELKQLYRLLPAVYREKDAAEGYPLRALFNLIEEQADILQVDIRQLWNNFFIQTCEHWVIPYIGDLVSNNLLYDESRSHTDDTAQQLFRDLSGRDLLPEMAIRTRADIAKTIYYRRRKGTLAMLEELARDVTGWAAHSVEFFQLLEWTQNLNHLRLACVDGIELRDVEALDRLDGPFDKWSHTVDVRPPSQAEGWHNIPNIGFFLWRLRGYPLEKIPARPGSEVWQYHFSPLGNPAPLFTPWRREGDETGLATELHVPEPIRPAFFYKDLERHRLRAAPRPNFTDLYGPFDQERSFHIERNGIPLDPALDPTTPPDLYQPQIVCRKLYPWPVSAPSGQVIAVDVEHGRIAVGDGWGDATTSLEVSFHYGFSADLGGGPYERGKWLVDPILADLRLYVQQDGSTPGSFTTLGAALAEWSARGRPNTIITVLDNQSYAEPLTIEPADDAWLVIEAANGVRPHLQPDGGRIRITGNHPESRFTLSGLLVEGAVEVEGDLGCLRLLHSTLVPGRSLNQDGKPASSEPSILVAGESDGVTINADLEVQAAYSIIGPIRLPSHGSGLWLLDSIVDGIGGAAISATGPPNQPAPPAVLERVTIFGPSYFRMLTLASEVIFTEPASSEQRHEGCVRFSFVPAGSITPRRYRCQPDLQAATAQEKAVKEALAGNPALTEVEINAIRDSVRTEVQSWLVPGFTAEDYGLPGYAQLRISCPAQIRKGAEDGSEMGALCHLKQAQRETNLRIRLDEYLPFGLVPGFIYIT